jgi:hypothetical protein
MGKIVVSQNVTLDGVVEDPSGEGGFRHGGWFAQFIGQDWDRGTGPCAQLHPSLDDDPCASQKHAHP